MVKRFRDNCIRSAWRGRRPLLAWLFCLALVVATLPAPLAACAKPADCGTATGRACCGCCDVTPEESAQCSAGTQPASSLRAAGCEIADPAPLATAVSAWQIRGGKSLAGDDAADDVVVDAASPAVTWTVRRHGPELSSHSSPGPDTSGHPGRAPPCAVHILHS